MSRCRLESSVLHFGGGEASGCREKNQNGRPFSALLGTGDAIDRPFGFIFSAARGPVCVLENEGAIRPATPSRPPTLAPAAPAALNFFWSLSILLLHFFAFASVLSSLLPLSGHLRRSLLPLPSPILTSRHVISDSGPLLLLSA